MTWIATNQLGHNRPYLVRGKTQVLLSRHNTNGVGVAHAAAPALNTHDRVLLVEDTQLQRLADAPLEAAVDVFLPRGLGEVGFLLVEVEGVDTTVEMGVLYVG